MSGRAELLRYGYRGFVRPVLFRLGKGDAEVAHETTLRLLARVGKHRITREAMRRISGVGSRPVTVAGIDFPNRVGLAAGMDKNGLAVAAWPALGFGHVELGTVTAHPQPGNPAPRMFRLPDSGAVINRMGFNNQGATALAQRVAAMGIYRGNNALGIPIGVSIGKSKVTPIDEAVADYLVSLRAVAPHADYVAINVSSPNTPGLRALQDRESLTELVDALVAEADQTLPIFLKLAPDLSEPALDELLEVCVTHGISGLIATNTTVERSRIVPAERVIAAETGGLSGAPLTQRSRDVVAYVRQRCELPLIASGGIMTPGDAQAMFDVGADLVQVMTGLIYAGPSLIAGINGLRESR